MKPTEKLYRTLLRKMNAPLYSALSKLLWQRENLDRMRSGGVDTGKYGLLYRQHRSSQLYVIFLIQLANPIERFLARKYANCHLYTFSVRNDVYKKNPVEVTITSEMEE